MHAPQSKRVRESRCAARLLDAGVVSAGRYSDKPAHRAHRVVKASISYRAIADCSDVPYGPERFRLRSCEFLRAGGQ